MDLNNSLMSHEINLIKHVPEIEEYQVFCVNATQLDSYQTKHLSDLFCMYGDLNNYLPSDVSLLRINLDDHHKGLLFLSVLIVEDGEQLKLLSTIEGSPNTLVYSIASAVNKDGSLGTGCIGVVRNKEFFPIDKLNHMPDFVSEINDISQTSVVHVFCFLKWLQSREYKIAKTLNRRGRMYKGALTPQSFSYIYKTKVEVSEAVESNPVEWTHCWDVMGHYRKLDGIGRNRKGIRCEKGRTWVTPYQKQRHLEHVKKVKILKD